MSDEPVTDLAALTLDYRVAFLRYLPRQEEVALAAGYELGRRAFMGGISILELARIHHEILLEVLQDAKRQEVPDLALSASTFLLEVLSTYDMAQRGLSSP